MHNRVRKADTAAADTDRTAAAQAADTEADPAEERLQPPAEAIPRKQLFYSRRRGRILMNQVLFYRMKDKSFYLPSFHFSDWILPQTAFYFNTSKC